MGGCSTTRPGRFTPRKEQLPIVYEAVWAPVRVRKIQTQNESESAVWHNAAYFKKILMLESPMNSGPP
jgi:hypothetical protein